MPTLWVTILSRCSTQSIGIRPENVTQQSTRPSFFRITNPTITYLAKCCKMLVVMCFSEKDPIRQDRLFTVVSFILGERLPASEPQHCFQSLKVLSHHVKRFIQLWYFTVFLLPPWQIHCPHSFTITSPPSLPFAFIVHKGKKRSREEREKGGVRKTSERERSAKRRQSQRRGGDCRDRTRGVAPSWNLNGLPLES